MAEHLQVTDRTIRNYEHDERVPKRPVLAMWAQLCAVPIEWLAEGLTDGSHPHPRSRSRAEQRRPRDGGTTIGTGDGTYRSHHRYHHSRQRMMRLALVNRPARQSCSV